MTYDTAVWKPALDLPDPAAEFERRMGASEDRYPDYRPPVPELLRLADLLEAHFPTDPAARPWEDLRGSLDGDFLYLTMAGQSGPKVEQFIADHAATLGLVVFSPLTEDYVSG